MNTKKPEIVFVWNYLEWGGAQLVMLGVMRLALTRGYRVSALIPAGTTGKILAYLDQENVPVTFFDAHVDLAKARTVWSKIRRRGRDWRCHFVLARHLAKQRSKDKVVFIDAAPWSNFLLLSWLARQMPTFVMLHIAHSNKPTLANGLSRLKFRLLERTRFYLLASNREMKESLRWYTTPAIWRTIPVAYTGVNVSEIRSVLAQPLDIQVERRRFSLPDGALVVMTLANVIERKGFRVWLEAARLLHECEPELVWIWVGTGEGHPVMEAFIQSHKMERFVRLIHPAQLGSQRPDLLRFLRLADLFVLPSYREGLPGALLEAMALGKAVIASDINAIPEAVQHGENGLLVQPGNARELSDAVRRLANNSLLRQAMGRKAQQTVLTHFLEESCAEITLDYIVQMAELR